MGQLRNPHLGEILKEEFLNEIGVSQNQLAQAVGRAGQSHSRHCQWDAQYYS
jgi:plasmid maintenance system antidote protein VapI